MPCDLLLLNLSPRITLLEVLLRHLLLEEGLHLTTLPLDSRSPWDAYKLHFEVLADVNHWSEQKSNAAACSHLTQLEDSTIGHVARRPRKRPPKSDVAP